MRATLSQFTSPISHFAEHVERPQRIIAVFETLQGEGLLDRCHRLPSHRVGGGRAREAVGACGQGGGNVWREMALFSQI